MVASLWDRLVAAASRRLPASALDTWIRHCRLIALEGDQLKIAVPNSFSRDWIAQRHIPALEAAAAECIGGRPRVSIVVDSTGDFDDLDHGVPPAGGSGRPHATLESLIPRYTFDTFVVGSGNQFAQAASQAVAELPSRAYNPLFIYGGVGLGKTHLLHAVGHQSAKLFAGMTVSYVSTERFTNELINAIRYDRTAEFRGRYRTIDLLLVDDIQFISGKERTQEEFFHTFNDLYESRKQIVVSSDCSPKDIADIDERLRSRFEWGLIADIQPPDFETRVAILKKKAAQERVCLGDDVAYHIAGRVKSNIRELEGSLTRMIAFCTLTGREMGMDLAREVLAEIWGEENKVITIDQIQRRVGEAYNVKLSELKAKSRTKTVAFPRQIAMYLARRLTHASLAEIGHAFGGKDHTTVLHAVQKITALIEGDPTARRSVDTLIQDINP